MLHEPLLELGQQLLPHFNRSSLVQRDTVGIEGSGGGQMLKSPLHF
jgi:hypothetical protein